MGFTTKIINTVSGKADGHFPTHVPVYSNAAFTFESAEAMESAFLGRTPDHIYSRISNPTVEHFEKRVQSITGALAVTAVSSGMAAIANVFITIAKSGDNFITSRSLFGNTFSLFHSTLNSLGVEPRFCDLSDPKSILEKIDDRTVAIFFETITNPQLEIADISILSEIAKSKNIVLISDSTITPPNIFKAAKFGVNIEVISSTKIISGGATSIGGLIIDYGNYNWTSNSKLSDLSKRFGPFAFNFKLKKEVQRNIGACLSPFNAYLQSLGLETLELRFNKSVENCLEIARFLSNHSKIKKVNYPGLSGSEYYVLANKQFGKLPGSILTFELVSREKCFEFLNRLKILRRATNLNDNRSLIMHPASTIYCDYQPEERIKMKISDTLIRLSVGIEDIEDLLSDIEFALETV
jgi:O-acetylhomoserine (thiol)-lyase